MPFRLAFKRESHSNTRYHLFSCLEEVVAAVGLRLIDQTSCSANFGKLVNWTETVD